MHSETDKALNTALAANFTNQTERGEVTKNGFQLTYSFYDNGDIAVLDEWNDGSGRELVRVGDKVAARVYVGRSLPDAKLDELEITKADIMIFLATIISEHTDSIRLDTDFSHTDNDWSYEYKILDKEGDFDITVGKEKIFYKGKCVFVHVFAKSPVNG